MIGRGTHRLLLILPALLFGASCQQPAVASENVVRAPAAKVVAHEAKGLKKAIFAGGCFWGVEAVFSHVKGVTSAVSGYHGGSRVDAKYHTVSGGSTGHAEAVKIVYDPSVVRYDELLRIFFSVVADPTLKNRQRPDVGTQYRTALVPLDAEQRKVATAYLQQLQAAGLWKKPIVAKVEKYRAFYPAEASHQDFMLRNPGHPYIRAWDAPKVSALERLYPGWFSKGFIKG